MWRRWRPTASADTWNRCAMLFSMSPRRSWRSMLTSFGCEQMVQVRAMQCDSKRARAGRHLKTYSGTRQPRATAKRAQYSRRQLLAFLMCFACFTAASRTPPWLPSGWDVGIGVFPEGEEVLVVASARDASDRI